MNGIINRAGEVSIEAELKAGENSGTVEMPDSGIVECSDELQQ